ncbi:AAA family ATPase [Aggregatilineales bacterium SYSU G02658]
MNQNDVDAVRSLLRGQSVDVDQYRFTQRGMEIIAVLQAISPDQRAYRALPTLYRMLDKGEIERVGLAPHGSPRQSLMPASALHELPPLQWLLDHELPTQSLVVLYGESGIGKSFVTLDYAMRLATQSKCVVYVATEGLRGYHPRVAAWASYKQQRIPSSLLFYADEMNLMNSDAMISVAQTFSRLTPSLIVVDTLAMSMIGADENSARDMGQALASCRRLIDMTGATVMLVHHSGKASAWERGSSALRGNADVMMRLQSADDILVLETTKAKDFDAPPPKYLQLLEHAGSLVPIVVSDVDGTRKRLTTLQRKVLDSLAMETCADGVSLRELAEIVGAPYSTLHRAVSNAMTQELVRKDKGGYTLTERGRLIQRDPNSSELERITVTAQNTQNKGSDALNPANFATDPVGDPVIHVIQPQLTLYPVDHVDHVDQRISRYYKEGL